MITSNESDAADLLKWLERRVSRLESEREPEGSINQLRSVADTELSADSVSATTDTSPGFTWGESAWGYDAWT